jgi:hypothetical protein
MAIKILLLCLALLPGTLAQRRPSTSRAASRGAFTTQPLPVDPATATPALPDAVATAQPAVASAAAEVAAAAGNRTAPCTSSRQCGAAPRYCLMPFSPPQDDPAAPAVAMPRLAVCMDAQGFADCDPRAPGARCGKAGVCMVRGQHECSVPTKVDGPRPCGYCMELVWA